MLAVNTKSMFHMLCQTMEKLESDEIDVSKASAMSKLVGQANNLLNYELKRAVILSNPDYKDQHRNLESKNFDSID
jgi:hypothetical protein